MTNTSQVAQTTNETCYNASYYIRKCLGEVLGQFPEALRGNLYQKFEEEYKNPMTKDLEFLVRKRLTDEEARIIQFEPNASQYRYYAPVISLAFVAPSSAAASTWKILQKRFLTMLYLKHARNWPFVTEFILQEGLQILADLFLSPDFQMRGQAIDSFIQMTSHPSFDWFVQPKGYEQKLLHSKMLQLSNVSSGFLRQLIANVIGIERSDLKDQELLKEKAQKFPGGSYVILQILAFYLSWVRKLHSANNELRLSRQLLNILRDWETLNQDAEMIPEEKELAQNVYEDFSRWPAIDEDNSKKDMTQDSLVSIDTVLDDKDFFSIHRMTMLLEEKKEEEVISICTTSIKANVCVADAYRFRAKAKLQQMLGSPNTCDPEKAQSCLEDCNETLTIDPTCVDTLKDKLEVFLRLQMFQDARRLLESILAVEEEEIEKDQFLLSTQEKEYFQQQEKRLERLENEEAKRNSNSSREDEIFEAILVRHGVLSSTSSTEGTHTSSIHKIEKTQEDTIDSTLLPIEFKNPLAALKKIKASTKKKTSSSSASSSNSTGSSNTVLREQQLLLKKCLQLRNNPFKMNHALRKHSANQIIQAIGSHLTEDLLVSLLEALQVEQKEASDVRKLIDLLVKLPRFSLVKEMASDSIVTKIDTSIEMIRTKQTQPSPAG